MNCMVVPFGSALERRSRTTYRPTVAPEGSTHVDTAFTGTTSSFSRTASGRLTTVVVVHKRFLRRLPRPLDVFGGLEEPLRQVGGLDPDLPALRRARQARASRVRTPGDVDGQSVVVVRTVGTGVLTGRYAVLCAPPVPRDRSGLSGPTPHGGRPRRPSSDDEDFAGATAITRPTKRGRPFSRWSIRKPGYLHSVHGRVGLHRP